MKKLSFWKQRYKQKEIRTKLRVFDGNICLEKHHPGKDHMTFRGTILYIREVRIEPRLDDGKKAGSVFT